MVGRGRVVRYFGNSYWVWRRRVACDWAQAKAASLTHTLGTKYMKVANLGAFRCRTLGPSKDIVSLKPGRARGEMFEHQTELHGALRVAADSPTSLTAAG